MGQRILIETSIIITYIRTRHKGNTTLFEKAIATYHRCFLSALNVYEVEFGAARAGRTSDLYLILPFVEVLGVDQQVAEQAAQLHSLLISQNRDIGIKDVFIAATCLVHALPILTYNVSHFSRVPGLQIIPPF